MKKKNCFILFSLIFVITYMFVFIFKIKFSMADDYLINNIISGTFGNSYDAQILYINNIIGAILKILYFLIPYVNFYSFYFILTICICYTLIAKKIIEEKKYILFPVIAVLYFINIFNITFTIVAYLSCIVGLIRLTCSKDSNKWVDGGLILNGCLIRSSVVLPLMAAVGILILIRILKEKDKKYIRAAGIIFIALVVCYFSGEIFYKRNNDLKEFRQWQIASSNIRDYKRIPYDKYNEIEWNKNDVDMFYTWNFADRDKFSTQKMKKLVSSVEYSDRYNLDIKNIVKNLVQQYKSEKIDFDNVYIVLFVILLVVSIITCKNRYECAWMFICTILINFLLIVRGRNVYRVVFPQYLLAIIYYIYSISDSKFTFKSKTIKTMSSVFCLFLSIICVGTITKQHTAIIEKNRTSYENNYKIAETIKNDGNLYIVDSSIYNNLTMNYNITERKGIGEYANIVKAGGGDCFSLRYFGYIDRFGLINRENIYKNLTCDNVYYIGYPTDILDTYLKENVNPNGQLVEFKNIGEYVIYKYEVSK